MRICSEVSSWKVEFCQILFLVVTTLLRVESNEVCQTEACKVITKRFTSCMDETFKPCDDFYSFACQNYVKNTIIPEYEDDVMSFTEILDKVYLQLKSIFDQNLIPNGPQPFKNLRNFYDLCMDMESINAQGTGAAVEKLRQIGGWPVLGVWNENTWNILDAEIAINYFALRGGGLADYYVTIDMKNTSRRVLSVDQANLGIDQDYLVNGMDDPIVKAYYSYMVDIAVLYGADRQTASQQLKESLAFEIGLAKLCSPDSDRRDYFRMYNPYNLQQLQAEFPWVYWRQFLSGILPKDVPLKDNEIVVVQEVKYLKEVGDFISKTPKKVIANYMGWLAAWDLSGKLGDAFRNRSQEFSAILDGTSVPNPRWKDCLGEILDNSLSIVLSNLYIEKFFKKQSKVEASALADRTKQEMNLVLQQIDWMDSVTRERALNKVKLIRKFVGYPEELLDVSKIVQHYGDLAIDGNSLLLETLKLYQWDYDYESRRLRQPVDPDDWRDHSDVTDVNAFYRSTENSIAFPGGILQLPFFDADLPKYVNYAAIGSVIGHEITHGFDDMGSQFDGYGDLVEWWTNASKAVFNQKEKCFIDQYNKYVDKQTGLHINGVNTQGENVADSGGIKLAFHAYQKLGLNEPLLPGFEKYTQEQLFFISSATMFCEKARTEALRDFITTDAHPPNRFRVIGMLQNFPEFSKVWGCTANAYMNPPNRCAVW